MLVVRSMLLFALLLGSTACVKSSPGVVHVDTTNPIVTIGGGLARIGGGNAFRTWYYIDRSSQTCWMEIGSIGGAIDCCKARNVPAAREHITWETDASCAARFHGTAASGEN